MPQINEISWIKMSICFTFILITMLLSMNFLMKYNINYKKNNFKMFYFNIMK